MWKIEKKIKAIFALYTFFSKIILSTNIILLCISSKTSWNSENLEVWVSFILPNLNIIFENSAELAFISIIFFYKEDHSEHKLSVYQ